MPATFRARRRQRRRPSRRTANRALLTASSCRRASRVNWGLSNRAGTAAPLSQPRASLTVGYRCRHCVASLVATPMKPPLRISPAERDVLSVLWKSAPLTTAEIVEALSASKGWSRGTTRTLLARLVRKKAVGCRLDGHRHQYRPLIAEKVCVRLESRGFLDRVFGGESADMLLALVEETQLTPDQIQRFRDILDRKER